MIGGTTVNRVCTKTGFTLLSAQGGPAWRVTKDQYVARDGVNGARVNALVGSLPVGTEDVRCRYDTIGRTVYFGDSQKVALAECLQAFRSELMSMTKDADAIGLDVDTYRQQITAELHSRGKPGPGEIPVDWQMKYSIYEVDLPHHGWWVSIETHQTLNAVSSKLRGTAGQLTLGTVCGEDRGVTTKVAHAIRTSVLDDGELPLGIAYPSKTGYGHCWAWWNRRADDGLLPGGNDPSFSDSTNVNIQALYELIHDWDLKLVGGAH